MITIRHHGSLTKTTGFLDKANKLDVLRILRKRGEEGVRALYSLTPKDSGKTASSWSYQITVTAKSARLIFLNSHQENGIYPYILIQYGHSTKGRFVEGRDYINPAIRPVFEKFLDELGKEVSLL